MARSTAPEIAPRRPAPRMRSVRSGANAGRSSVRAAGAASTLITTSPEPTCATRPPLSGIANNVPQAPASRASARAPAVRSRRSLTRAMWGAQEPHRMPISRNARVVPRRPRLSASAALVAAMLAGELGVSAVQLGIMPEDAILVECRASPAGDITRDPWALGDAVVQRDHARRIGEGTF